LIGFIKNNYKTKAENENFGSAWAKPEYARFAGT
jgi:hypothetical protein